MKVSEVELQELREHIERDELMCHGLSVRKCTWMGLNDRKVGVSI